LNTTVDLVFDAARTTDWTYTSNSDNVTYYINVCNNLVSSNPCGNDVPAYMYDAATGDCMRLGLLSAEWWGDSCAISFFFNVCIRMIYTTGVPSIVIKITKTKKKNVWI
jgi:hypothetical protein